MTDKEIVERAKEAEKRTGFGELVHSPISKGVNSAYGIGFIEGMVEYRNSIQEEPVSKVYTFKSIPRLLEMIEPTDRAKFYATKLAERLESEGYPFDATLVRESIKIMNGEKVAMATMDKEPVSEELEEKAKRYATEGDEISGLYIIDEEVEAFKAGAQWQRQQLMKNAIERKVQIDAGGYPYIDVNVELYDYDKDIPLAKEGDKVMVNVIKED